MLDLRVFHEKSTKSTREFANLGLTLRLTNSLTTKALIYRPLVGCFVIGKV